MIQTNDMYAEIYSDWYYELPNGDLLRYGHRITGKSYNGKRFYNAELANVGAGTLGVHWHDTIINLDESDNYNDLMIIDTITINE